MNYEKYVNVVKSCGNYVKRHGNYVSLNVNKYILLQNYKIVVYLSFVFFEPQELSEVFVYSLFTDF